jgi:hypothetical protein
MWRVRRSQEPTYSGCSGGNRTLKQGRGLSLVSTRNWRASFFPPTPVGWHPGRHEPSVGAAVSSPRGTASSNDLSKLGGRQVRQGLPPIFFKVTVICQPERNQTFADSALRPHVFS